MPPTGGRENTSTANNKVQRGSGSGRAWAGGCARHEVESETERDAGDGEAEGVRGWGREVEERGKRWWWRRGAELTGLCATALMEATRQLPKCE